jgi:hypothetical protein
MKSRKQEAIEHKEIIPLPPTDHGRVPGWGLWAASVRDARRLVAGATGHAEDLLYPHYVGSIDPTAGLLANKRYVVRLKTP